MSSNFQAESSKSGNEFEEAVLNELSSLYDLDVQEIESNVTIPSIGIELDYILLTDEGLEVGEAKGGRPGPKKRPGAERTDNVKKAICNGALLQSCLPGTRYVVYFSAPPKQGSSSETMIMHALEAGFISEVRYLNPYICLN